MLRVESGVHVRTFKSCTRVGLGYKEKSNDRKFLISFFILVFLQARPLGNSHFPAIYLCLAPFPVSILAPVCESYLVYNHFITVFFLNDV